MRENSLRDPAGFRGVKPAETHRGKEPQSGDGGRREQRSAQLWAALIIRAEMQPLSFCCFWWRRLMGSFWLLFAALRDGAERSRYEVTSASVVLVSNSAADQILKTGFYGSCTVHADLYMNAEIRGIYLDASSNKPNLDTYTTYFTWHQAKEPTV